MDIIRDSAEHHFLSALETLKNTTEQWMVIHCPLSKTLTHDDFMSDMDNIPTLMAHAKQKGEMLIEDLREKTSVLSTGYLYLFSNCDVLLLAQIKTQNDVKAIQNIHKDLSQTLKERCSDVGIIPRDAYTYQKLADKKILSGRLFDAYRAMSDKNQVASIALRRERRDRSLVMLVEDDRFTAAHASSILGNDYDIVVARSGEEAVIEYIKHAPDIVYLDIHMPGISGLDALKSIQAVDPKSYVVIVSVDSSTNSLIKGKHNGMKGFIKKPFTKNRLMHMTTTSPYVHARALKIRSLSTEH